MVDRRRLRQILVNLLSNAVKFTEAGKVTLTVERTVKRTDEGVKGADATTKEDADEREAPAITRFHVCDTGIGISESDLALLFQPFQQLDGGLNRKYQGTGLGLVLARKLARLHGGDVTVTSVPGQGSCFTVHLPDINPSVSASVDC